MSELTELEVKGFKSVGKIHLKQLRKINYLVGANGCGKSGMFEALAIMSRFIRLQSASEVQLNVFGDINEIITDETEYRLKVHNAVNAENSEYLGKFLPRNHSVVYTNDNWLKCVTSTPNLQASESGGIQSQRWMCRILDSNSTADEQNSELRYPYPFVTNAIPDRNALRDFLNAHFVREGEYIRGVGGSPSGTGTNDIEITSNLDRGTTLRHEPLDSFSSGFKQLLGIYFSITENVRQFTSQLGDRHGIICIEEPGVGLNPRLQKKLPHLLNLISELEGNENLTFFVTTHSPFIISAASNLPTHKTYLLKNGKTANKAGVETVSSNGYIGADCLAAAANMIGAGFEDLGKAPNVREPIRVVYCEGESNRVRDSDMYKVIFRSLPEKFLFVSTGGFISAVNSYYDGRVSVKYTFGPESVATCLLDRSCSHKDIPVGRDEVITKTSKSKPIFSDNDRRKFLESDNLSGYRMLLRKEIENYLFDPSVIALLPEPERGVWNTQKLTAAGISVTEIGFVSGEVKDYLRGSLNYLKMAELIHDNRAGATKTIYDELVACLEGSR